ncbi:MAG TPA: sulfate transporter [Actinomycetota bacterium]
MSGPEGSSARPAGAPGPPREPSATVLVLSHPIARADIPVLCRRLREVLEDSEADLTVCDARALVDPDAVTVDAVARLQLTARRLGRQVQLRHACDELHELLALMGLRDVLLVCGELLPLEPGGQAEEREKARGAGHGQDPGGLR